MIMKEKRGGLAKAISLLLITVSLVIILVGCGGNEDLVLKTKDEITAAISAEDNKKGMYAYDYIDDWGIPLFDKSKFKGTEIVYRDYYVEDLPDAYTMAKSTVELFLEYFYDKIDITDEDEITDGLIACYVQSVGDPYSFYRTADEFEDYDEDMSGEFAGIGVTVIYSYVEETMTVTAVSPGAGAQKAGILPGDLIIKADGVSVKELGYQKTISAIRGEIGTSVKVTVLRDGVEIDFDIVRQKIVEETVTYTIDENKIGYVTITEFKDVTYSQFKTAIDALEKEGVRGIIYDVRSNPGGYLHSVLDVLSYIIPKGEVLATFTNGYADPAKSDNKHTLLIPTVVVCDRYTASAGELFTSALRDYGTGEDRLFDVEIVGTRTFGKGIMQTSLTFTDGSALTLTVSYYNPPSGKNYHGEGITPTVTVENGTEGDAQMDAATAAVLELLANQQTNNK